MHQNKRLKKLLAAMAALAVLAIIYFLVSRADWNSEEEETTEEISVLTVSPVEIQEAVITNSYGTLRLAYDGESWTAPDDTELDLNQDALTNLWNRLNPLSAVRDLGEATEELSSYGLAYPAISIRITRDDGAEITVAIGGTASDGNVYVMTSESNHVYTCDSYLATAFTCQISDFEATESED